MKLEYPANFLQSKAWAKMNELVGHKVVTAKFGKHTNYLIVKSARRGRYLEIPGGPILNWSDQKEVEAAFAKIREIAKTEKCVFVRLRPQLLKTDKNLAILESVGAIKAPMHLHAEHTVIIDLAKSEEDLLADMRRQTRYEVRRADKLGIKVESDNSEELFREFHSVQVETARRQHFIPPDLKTLLAERTAFGKDIKIYTASIYENSDLSGPVGGSAVRPLGRGSEATTVGAAPATAPWDAEGVPTAGGRDRYPQVGDSRDETGSATGARSGEDATSLVAIAYGLILSDGAEAEYFEAASTDLNRKLPGAYALQWQIMKDLKKQGIKRYNLWGIAPPGVKNHRYSGVTTFKTGFGGEIVEFVPAHDIIISPARYKLDLAVEKIRKKRRNL